MALPKIKVIEMDHAPLFNFEKLVATPACMNKVDVEYAMTCLAQHMTGDWGVMDDEDKAANDRAVKNGGRIMSVYPLPDDPDVFWIITEHDRSVTTFLLPSDY